LLLATALFSTGMMQAPGTPPIKMGLWESTSAYTTTMDGAQMPGGDHTVKARSCYTAENWMKSFGSTQQMGCARSNEKWDGRRFSFDFSCPNLHGTGHVQVDFAGTDAGHGTLHMELDSGNHHIATDSTFDTHFVSADCGGVSPDRPVLVQ
jgi:hypothetical protein